MPPLEYLAVPQILTDGKVQGPMADVVGGLIAGPIGLFNNIKTATTTVVKTGAGVLNKVVINTTAAGTITIYDNTSAAGATIATIAVSAIGPVFMYDLAFTLGLTVVTAAASDITVTYR
jgi:hypothetical protein